MKIKLWLAELRAPFFTASIIPVLLGTSIAWRTNSVFNWKYFLAALFGGIFLHAGANVANDYFDYKNGTDNINKEFIRPFCGGSRMIQNGLMKPNEVLLESLICFLIAGIIGLWLILELGYIILVLGIIGATSGFFYTAPPFKFASRGIGEILIGLNFGTLMTLGAFFVQTQQLNLIPIIASLPVALLITAVLYINEFPDFNADREAGKLHLVARLGRKSASRGYTLIICAIYLSIIGGIVSGYVPVLALFTLLTLPLAYLAVKLTLQHYDDPPKMAKAMPITIQLHLIIGLILSASYIISAL